jgi:general stress protein YciG
MPRNFNELRSKMSPESQARSSERAAVHRAKNPHAVALGRKGGKVNSEAKAEAARENGKKGGRPKKKKSET